LERVGGADQPAGEVVHADRHQRALAARPGVALVAQEAKEIKTNQIEAARKTMSRLAQGAGKIWIRIFTDKPVTTKPAEVGMGHGKGDPAFFVARVRAGTVLFEIDGLSEEKSREALRKASAKLPVKAKIVAR
ncbi:MAG: 50S ribosomal protein L16, partial [Parcubacteria group bacterium GW2011_GWB2_40_8]